ncbi:hypothetical protein NHX12_007646 [Muraenolepis orangiensis]|uniref:Centromere protein J C-terminal domain-containing protein n=1 Tax=Muraenolepis orangiensis TaxID=630683 RepID=A0A9Q0DN94_9TELE|nr:hypothetical protein NHX12_007646 [Muraenolepis orangiensis]
MSSPTGLGFSQGDFLSRWMPSSARAGVILKPSPDLVDCPGYSSVESPGPRLIWGSEPGNTDDSFTSSFAPLPTSTNSSCCIGVNVSAQSEDWTEPGKVCQRLGPSGVERTGRDAHLNGLKCGPLGHSAGELDSVEETGNNTPHDLSLIMKLDQLRRLSGPELREVTLQGVSPPREVHCSLSSHGPGVPQGSMLGPHGNQESPQAQREDSGHMADITEESEACVSREEDSELGCAISSEQDDPQDSLLPCDRNDQGGVPQGGPPKRVFLKRGQGLSRFTGRPRGLVPPTGALPSVPPPRARPVTRSNSEPTTTTSQHHKPVQRKTAVLNKENRSPPAPTVIRGGGKVAGGQRRKVLVPRQQQQQNPEEPEDQLRPGRQHRANGAGGQNTRLGLLQGRRASHPVQPSTGSVMGRHDTERLRGIEGEVHQENEELGEFELLEQAAEELSFSSNSSFVMKVLHMDRQLQAGKSLHQRRLSSTPIKPPGPSPPKAQPDCSRTRTSPCSEALLPGVGCAEGESEEESGVDVADGKHPPVSDDSYCSGSEEFADRGVDKQTAFPSSLCFPVQPNPPYNKSSDSVLTNPEDSTLVEDSDGHQGGVEFDDDDTWNDLEETAVAPPTCPLPRLSPSERILTRKVAASRGTETSTEPIVTNQELPEPTIPASQLMARLFPSLKPKSQNAPVPVVPEAKQFDEAPGQQVQSQQVQSRQLRERLVELELEIERFKKENKALSRLREENERSKEELRSLKLEEVSKEENRKLQRDKKLFEQHTSAARAIPDKKEREEIQSLKQQLISLQEEVRRKESRWGTTHCRLRQQIDTLNTENTALKEEVNTLERGSSLLVLWTPGEPILRSVASRPPRGALGRTASPGLSPEEKPVARPPDKTLEPEPPLPSLETALTPTSKRAVLYHVEEEEANESRESNTEVNTQGKMEQLLPCGGRLIVFPNGTRKELSADGLTATVTFFNGDTKQVMADQRVVYYYAEAHTTHTTFPDGMEILQFPNHQNEKHFPDGRKEITFPDQTVKTLFPDGREESVLTDGTVIHINPDGSKEIQFNTGQKEVHTAEYKRREYPDGTVKTVYSHGRQETRYPTGRVRIKDKDGNVLSDKL